MADEDEIDVLGDYSLDNLLSNNEPGIYDHSALASQSSDLLSCDYAINSSCWFNSSNSDFSTDLPAVNATLDYSQDANQITDESGWTEKEKSLLEQGIEIFGKSNVRLAQFIGSKIASEVKYYLRHYYSDVQLYSNINEEIILDNNIIEETIVSDVEPPAVLDDAEIPASIEEVIAVVSTAKPTIPCSKRPSPRKCDVKSGEAKVNYSEIPSGHSLLKATYFKQSKTEPNITNKRDTYKQRNPPKKFKESPVKFKIKTKLKKSDISRIKSRNRKISTKSETESNESTSISLVTGNGLAVPVCSGEEVIKIQNASDYSDSEIDIEDMDDFMQNEILLPTEVHRPLELKREVEIMRKIENDLEKPKLEISDLDEELREQLMSMEFPKTEVELDDNNVTELEKFVHSEFFEGRPTKTPSRYLMIRNHIINCWLDLKPLYVTKTSIRPGLKRCGDVNLIGRIHYFLEQIGAINYNCPQTNYVRPLYDEFMCNIQATKEKPKKEPIRNVVLEKAEYVNRSRNKKKFNNDGEGGCTLTHDENGAVINTMIVNEEPVAKQRTFIKRPSIRLIYCKPFTEDNPQKYKINLHLSALLLMDLHAHTSLSEVMGLIGGHWDPQAKILTISRYEPCKNIAPSATHCDMCPITQAKAADIIHNEGLNILGWYHSHPTFAPEPSQQDLDTQLSVQQWIGNNKPCIGVILSPFSLHGALIASPYRCMIVDKKLNFEDQFVPYKFNVNLISSDLNVDLLLTNAWNVFHSNYNGIENQVDFRKTYFQDDSLSYMDKFITSVKMHLAKCTDVNKMTCDSIIQGLAEICCCNA